MRMIEINMVFFFSGIFFTIGVAALLRLRAKRIVIKKVRRHPKLNETRNALIFAVRQVVKEIDDKDAFQNNSELNKEDGKSDRIQ